MLSNMAAAIPNPDFWGTVVQYQTFMLVDVLNTKSCEVFVSLIGASTS